MVNQLVAFGYLPYLQQDSIATKQASSKRRRVVVMFFCMCFSSLFNAISVISVVWYAAIDVFGHLGWCIVLSDCGIISVISFCYRWATMFRSETKKTGAMGHSQYPIGTSGLLKHSPLAELHAFRCHPPALTIWTTWGWSHFSKNCDFMVGLDGSSMRRGTNSEGKLKEHILRKLNFLTHTHTHVICS